MLPPYAPAASLVPSAEEVIPYHCFADPTLVSSVQVAPLLLEVQMLPKNAHAASFVPSADEVIPYQLLPPPPTTRSVQVAPLLSEVHMLPANAHAASFVPSADEVIQYQLFVPSPTTRSVQVAAEPHSSNTSKKISTGMIILEMDLGGGTGGGVVFWRCSWSEGLVEAWGRLRGVGRCRGRAGW